MERWENRASSCDASESQLDYAQAVRFLNAEEPATSYSVPPDAVLALVNGVDSEVHRALRLRRLFIELIREAPEKLDALVNTPAVIARYQAAHKRILQGLFHLPDAFFDAHQDKFQKDLALCTLRMFPAGAGLVERRDAVPLRALMASPRRQLGTRLRFAMLHSYRRRPVYRIHIDSRDTSEFSEAGWQASYLRIAQMMEREPQVVGLTRNAWFIDPALKDVSPHLAYIRDFLVEQGAYVFFSGFVGHPEHDAVVSSKTREALFNSGEYRPANYFVFWPRRAMLKWAKKTAGPAPTKWA